MELTTWSMYWLVKLDNIQTFFIIMGFFSSGSALFGPLIAIGVEVEKYALKILLISISVVVLSFGCATLIPNTKQMAAIVILPKIINNEQVQQMPDKILNLGLEWLEELRPNIKDSK